MLLVICKTGVGGGIQRFTDKTPDTINASTQCTRLRSTPLCPSMLACFSAALRPRAVHLLVGVPHTHVQSSLSAHWVCGKHTRIDAALLSNHACVRSPLAQGGKGEENLSWAPEREPELNVRPGQTTISSLPPTCRLDAHGAWYWLRHVRY
eukprot:3702542-Rhodomonas_salina.2